MDLSAKQVRLLCLPTGAFFDTESSIPWNSLEDGCLKNIQLDHNISPILWDRSTNNPAKRIETLDVVPSARWRIDGSDNQGAQFHVVPIFTPTPSLKRIDVFIPSQECHPPHLRNALNSAWAFCLRDSRVASLGLARHIIRALENWTNEVGEDRIAKGWEDAPYGSRIEIDRICANPKDMICTFKYDYYLEDCALSLSALQSMWGYPLSVYPDTIDINTLTLIRQLHDTISLVSLPKSGKREEVIFKSTTQDTRYLYHELKLLLAMPEHAGIMSRPLYLVTGKTRHGEEKVFGFILPYYRRGNLADILGHGKHIGSLSLKDQLRWARQVTQTLKVINSPPAKFYSELKVDNLLVNEDGNIVFIDFEQSGQFAHIIYPETLLLKQETG